MLENTSIGAVPHTIAPELVLSNQAEASACESEKSMKIPSRYPFSSASNKPSRFALKTLGDAPTLIRLWLCIPSYYQQEPVISKLISTYGITVIITGARLEPNANNQGEFDVKLKGTPEQLRAGLAYLQALNVKIRGKANPGYDGWHC